MNPDLTFHEFRGAEIRPHLDELGRLRIAVFREFPYLYDGDFAYERNYLRVYAESAGSLVILLKVDGRTVGASTCLPMSDEDSKFQEPLIRAGIDVDTVFYLGESVILPKFRGGGAGHEFFRRREGHARALGYPVTAFCAVDRAPDHPARPTNYRPLDAFWTRMGYRRRDDLRCELAWKEVGEEEESSKTLTYWMREWT